MITFGPGIAAFRGPDGGRYHVRGPSEIPLELMIWFGWYAAAIGWVWRCYTCGCAFLPDDERARYHAREHVRAMRAGEYDAQWAAREAALQAAEAERRAVDRVHRRKAYTLRQARLSAARAEAAERGAARRLQGEARSQHQAELDAARAERAALAVDSAIDSLLGPLLERAAARRHKRRYGPDWLGLHRRRCVCERCAARYPERLADWENLPDAVRRRRLLGARPRDWRGRWVDARYLRLVEAHARYHDRVAARHETARNQSGLAVTSINVPSEAKPGEPWAKALDVESVNVTRNLSAEEDRS